MLTNEDIVRRYRKSQQTWKWNARRESWLRKLADRLVYWKMPRLWTNVNNNVSSLSAEAFKNWFKNQENSWPIRWILWTALWTTLWWVYDAVNIPVQWYRNAYNAIADFYNAWASERNALNQDAITSENAQELWRQNNMNNKSNWLWTNVSPYVDNNYYWMWNQATLNYISNKINNGL